MAYRVIGGTLSKPAWNTAVNAAGFMQVTVTNVQGVINGIYFSRQLWRGFPGLPVHGADDMRHSRITTFIATGNIATSGSNTTYALNFAGYSGQVAGTRYAPTGICVNSHFPSLYPTQFCDLGTQTYKPHVASDLGNFAFLAGGWIGADYPGRSGYIGGNITIGSSSTTIAGSASALALGATVQNSMGGSTTFNLQKMPATFDMTGGASGVGGNTTTTPGAGTVSIQWTRYL